MAVLPYSCTVWIRRRPAGRSLVTESPGLRSHLAEQLTWQSRQQQYPVTSSSTLYCCSCEQRRGGASASMPKRAAATDSPAQLGKRRSKPPQRYHELAAAEKPEDDASDSDEPEGLARFTPASLDQPSKAVRQSLQKKENGRERRTVRCCASPVCLPSTCA